MKKIFSMMLLCTAVLLASCSEDEDPVPADSVTINKTLLELTEGFSETLVASITPDNARSTAMVWSSSDTNVVTVTGAGEVTAVSVGKAVITVRTAEGGHEATCAVTITPKTAEVAFLLEQWIVKETVWDGYVEIPVSISNAMLGDVYCTIQTVDGTAVSFGNYWDYKLENAEIKIDKGAKEGKIILKINDSGTQKEDRTFKLRITSVRSSCGNEEIKLDNRHFESEVIIQKAFNEVNFVKPYISADKQMSPIAITIRMDRPLEEDVTVCLTYDGVGMKDNKDYKVDTKGFEMVYIPVIDETTGELIEGKGGELILVKLKAGETTATIELIALENVEGYCRFAIYGIRLDDVYNWPGDDDFLKVADDPMCVVAFQKTKK